VEIYFNHLGSNHLYLTWSPVTGTSHVLAAEEVRNHQVDFRIANRTKKYHNTTSSALGSPVPVQVPAIWGKTGEFFTVVSAKGLQAMGVIEEAMSW